MDNWYMIDGVVVKNPSKEVLNGVGVGKSNIVELRVGTSEDVIIETWRVEPLESDLRIDFAYPPLWLSLPQFFKDDMRDCHFKDHGVFGKVHGPIRYTLPPSYFTNDTVNLPSGFGQ